MTQTTIPAWVKGTLLEEILSFNEPFTTELAESQPGDEIIDECTEPEKILVTIVNKKVSEAKALAEIHTSCENHGPHNPDCVRLHELAKEIDFLKDMSWFFIEKRMGTLAKTESLAIVENFKIVKKTTEESEDGGLLQALLSAGAISSW